MNKKLISLGVSAALMPAAAIADSTLYGKGNISLGFLDNGIDDSVSLSSNSSRLGVKGKYKLDDSASLSAIYKYELQIDLTDHNDNKDKGDGGEHVLKSRDAWVGLKGSWGSLQFGRQDTPYKLSTNKGLIKQFGFGDIYGDYNDIFKDNREDNTIGYHGKFSPVRIGASYTTDRGSRKDEPSTTANDKAAYSLMAAYDSKPVYVTAAYLNENEGGGTKAGATKAEDAIFAKVAAGAKFGNFLVRAMYENQDFDTYDGGVWAVGGAVKMGKGTINAYYGQKDAELMAKNNTPGTIDDGTIYAVNYMHKLNKHTSLYGLYASGQEGISLGAGVGDDVDATTNAGGAFEDTSAFAIGTIVKF